MKDYITIGSAPADEECAQVGTPNYHARAKRECLAFIKEIRKVIGLEPPLAVLKVESFEHDFGTYLDVVCWFDKDDPESRDYALRCEGEAPTRFASQSLHELKAPAEAHHTMGKEEMTWPEFWHIAANKAPLAELKAHLENHSKDHLVPRKFCFYCLLEKCDYEFSDKGAKLIRYAKSSFKVGG